MDDAWLAARFGADRTRLRAVADAGGGRSALGSAGEADDAVQGAWLRLRRADTSCPGREVRPRPLLARDGRERSRSHPYPSASAAAERLNASAGTAACGPARRREAARRSAAAPHLC